MLNVLDGEELFRRSRTPEIYADAAHAVLVGPGEDMAGGQLLCEDVLAESGVTDFAQYSPGIDETDLHPDAFVD